MMYVISHRRSYHLKRFLRATQTIFICLAQKNETNNSYLVDNRVSIDTTSRWELEWWIWIGVIGNKVSWYFAYSWHYFVHFQFQHRRRMNIGPIDYPRYFRPDWIPSPSPVQSDTAEETTDDSGNSINISTVPTKTVRYKIITKKFCDRTEQIIVCTSVTAWSSPRPASPTKRGGNTIRPKQEGWSQKYRTNGNWKKRQQW